MALYPTLKSVIIATACGGAFWIFYLRINRLIALMRSVTGKKTVTRAPILERIKIFFSDILCQSNVRRIRMPGTAHAFIFFGFLAVQPHSLELMINSVFHSFEIHHFLPHVYGAYLFIADIMAFTALLGLGYALFRRVIIKPAYLTLNRDALFIILFTSIIIISFHSINAFHMVLPKAAAGFNYAGYFTVSETVSNLFHLDSLPVSERVLGYEISCWVHLLMILGFLIYIPGSKHLHLLAAIPNVMLKPVNRNRVISKTDIENENAESFGLGNVSELNWKNVMDLYACTECGRCEARCPASITGKPLSPKRVISDIKHDLFHQAAAVMAENSKSMVPIITDGSPITGDVIWSCTTCRACEDICPVNIQHLDPILELRKNQVLMEAAFPPEMQETFTNLENQSNPWGFSSDDRANWCKEMDVPLMTDNPDADILYFVGCAGSFDDRGINIARAITRVLQKADVNFAVLGNEEKCNGDMARRTGNEYLAQMMIRENVSTLNQYKPKKILTGCPHCYNIIRNEYPQFGGRYTVVHHAEFFFDLIRQGRLTISGHFHGKTTYHDSCYLGRWNGLYNTPRELLHSALNGGRIIETDRHRDNGLCCGAGGARMFMEETIGKRINQERVEEMIKTHAKTVAVACPFCCTMLDDGIKKYNTGQVIKDVAEILDAVVS